MIRANGVNMPTPARPDLLVILPIGRTNRNAVYVRLRFDADGIAWWRLDMGGLPDDAADWFTSASFAAFVFGLCPPHEERQRWSGDPPPYRISYADIRGMIWDHEAEAR